MKGQGHWKTFQGEPEVCDNLSSSSTFTMRGIPSPGPRGCALTALPPDQHKSCLAGEGTRGAKGKIPMEVGAVQLSLVWSIEHWTGDGCNGKADLRDGTDEVKSNDSG